MAMPTLKIITKGRQVYGHLDSYLYTVSDTKGDVRYWKCRSKCGARLTTVNTGRSVLIRKEGTAASHATHGPDPEKVTALRIMGNMKRQAAEQVGCPPTAIMRQATEASTSVQARLPAIENIRKALLYERAKDLPPHRKIQAEGLQQQYQDENDDSIREAARSMCALAFVSPQDVPRVFDVFYEQVPDDFASSELF